MNKKQLVRKRRATRGRMKMRELGAARLCVHRTPRHVYAQLITSSAAGDQVLASASTLDKEVRNAGGITGNIKSAKIVGDFIAKRASAKGVTKVAFDRAGYKYHGCIKALADAARESGLEF